MDVNEHRDFSNIKLRHKLNKRQRIPKGQYKIDNPEKLATLGTQDTR